MNDPGRATTRGIMRAENFVHPEAMNDSARRPLPSAYIIGVRIDATSYADAVARIMRWVQAAESKYVCVCPVHSIMEAYDSPDFRTTLNNADLTTPDGMPLVWCLRALGMNKATRVYGPDLTRALLREASVRGVPVGFYGGRLTTLQRLIEVIRRQYPKIIIAYTHAPPFRALAKTEEERLVSEMNASGARIVFVGLGCPKQEQWMAAHKGTVRAVMVGVGAAFDFLSGLKPQAPRWMQCAGLEWTFRLATEPSRLWRRYLEHNPRFIALFAMQLLRLRKFR